MSVLSKTLEYVKFFIFSDDPEWCRHQFPQTYVINHNAISRGYVDLWLASQCKHFVITGHSTFSHHMVELNEPGGFSLLANKS